MPQPFGLIRSYFITVNIMISRNQIQVPNRNFWIISLANTVEEFSRQIVLFFHVFAIRNAVSDIPCKENEVRAKAVIVLHIFQITNKRIYNLARIPVSSSTSM